MVAHGRTVAAGTVPALLERTGERDFEESFVKLAFAEEVAGAVRSDAGADSVVGREAGR